MSTFSSASLSFLLNSSILSPGLKLGSVLPVCACLNSISSSSNFALSFFSMASRFSEAFCNWSNDLKNIIICKSFLDKNNWFFSINYWYRAATATKASKARALAKFWVSICSYKKQLVKKIWVKSCLSLSNYFIDMSPTNMTPFFVEKTCFWRKKTGFFDKKWTCMGGAHIYKIIK